MKTVAGNLIQKFEETLVEMDAATEVRPAADIPKLFVKLSDNQFEDAKAALEGQGFKVEISNGIIGVMSGDQAGVDKALVDAGIIDFQITA